MYLISGNGNFVKVYHDTYKTISSTTAIAIYIIKGNTERSKKNKLKMYNF